MNASVCLHTWRGWMRNMCFPTLPRLIQTKKQSQLPERENIVQYCRCPAPRQEIWKAPGAQQARATRAALLRVHLLSLDRHLSVPYSSTPPATISNPSAPLSRKTMDLSLHPRRSLLPSPTPLAIISASAKKTSLPV